MRDPVRPLRVYPERVLRSLRLLRPLRVDGVRPDPVRAEPTAALPGGAPGCDARWGLAVPPPGGASPQALQYPSSRVPEHPDCAHAVIGKCRLEQARAQPETF